MKRQSTFIGFGACAMGLMVGFGSGDLSSTATAATVRTYMVGNSLTWDSQPEGIKGLAQQRGNTFDVGYHIRCGSSLPNILANPNDTCIVPAAPYGSFQGGLSGHQWDSVTLQPFNAGSTLATDTAAVLSLINTTRQNAATRRRASIFTPAGRNCLLILARPSGHTHRSGTRRSPMPTARRSK